MGQEKKCSGSMLASDKGISVPPVGRSESLKAHAHTYTHLSVDTSFAASDKSPHNR